MQDAWIDPPLMFTPAFPLSTPGPHTHYKQMNFKPCTNCLLFHYIFYEPLRALIVLYQITANSHAVLNHWRPCSCCCHSMCLEQSSSRSVPIPDIFYFQNTPESHLFNISFPSVWLYHWLFFPQSPWSCLCCIHLSEFIIITLHYNTVVRALKVWVRGDQWLTKGLIISRIRRCKGSVGSCK